MFFYEKSARTRAYLHWLRPHAIRISSPSKRALFNPRLSVYSRMFVDLRVPVHFRCLHRLQRESFITKCTSRRVYETPRSSKVFQIWSSRCQGCVICCLPSRAGESNSPRGGRLHWEGKSGWGRFDSRQTKGRKGGLCPKRSISEARFPDENPKKSLNVAHLDDLSWTLEGSNSYFLSSAFLIRAFLTRFRREWVTNFPLFVSHRNKNASDLSDSTCNWWERRCRGSHVSRKWIFFHFIRSTEILCENDIAMSWYCSPGHQQLRSHPTEETIHWARD